MSDEPTVHDFSLPVTEQFPNTQPWPVKPPERHWLHRWHWLLDDDGAFYLGQWNWKFGWHFGWSGKPDPEDMDGWRYMEAASPSLRIASGAKCE
jgi:hypothetical protein